MVKNHILEITMLQAHMMKWVQLKLLMIMITKRLLRWQLWQGRKGLEIPYLKMTLMNPHELMFEGMLTIPQYALDWVGLDLRVFWIVYDFDDK